MSSNDLYQHQNFNKIVMEKDKLDEIKSNIIQARAEILGMLGAVNEASEIIESIGEVKPADGFKSRDIVKFGKAIVFITDYDNEEGYGLDGLGNWKKTNTWSFKEKSHLWQLATKEDFKNVLVYDANRRGFVHRLDLKKVITLNDKNERVYISGNIYKSWMFFGGELVNNGVVFMKDGDWVGIEK